MSEIKRNKNPLDGPPDKVDADIKCVLTTFERGMQKGSAKKGVVRKIKAQNIEPIHVLCSYMEGTIGFSLRGIDIMVTMRVDEVIEILKAAADANRGYMESLPKTFTDLQWKMDKKV